MVANELFGFVTDMWAIPGGVTKWHSTQVYVWVSVCSYDVEETCEWITCVFTECACSTATGFRMAHNKLNDKTGNAKKCVEEWPANNTSPISTKKSHHWWESLAFSFPVPIDCISCNAKVNLINEKITCISQELKSPNILKNVQNVKKSTAGQFPEVSTSHVIRWETRVLPKNQCNKTNVEQYEHWNVDKGVWILVQELYCVFEHISLELYLVWVHAQHYDQDQSQKNQ